MTLHIGKSLTGQTPATIPEVLDIAATGYTLKFVLAAAMTPFLYVLKSILTEQFGLQPIPAESDVSNMPELSILGDVVEEGYGNNDNHSA
jgi:hypothetical protein